MSASSSLSGNAAEPIVTEPGAVGNAVDAGVEPAVGGGGALLLLLSLPELPLLPQAASSTTPSSAAAAELMRFMVLLLEVVHGSGSSFTSQLRLHRDRGGDAWTAPAGGEPSGDPGRDHEA